MGVKQRYEDRKKKGERSSYVGVRERSIAKEIEGVASSISQRTQTWLKNHNNYLANYNNRFSKRKGTYEDAYVSDSGDWLTTVTGQKENFDKEASSILSMLDRYGDYLDPKWASSIKNALTSAGKQQADILKYATGDRDYWAQFASQDEYGLWQTDQKYRGKYTGQTYEDILAAMGQMEDGEEKQFLNSYRYEVLKQSDDFAQHSRYANDSKGLTKYLSDPTYEFINGKLAFALYDALAGVGANYNYDQMTEDEVSVYNYFYAKEGKEKAEEYLNSLQDTLVDRGKQEIIKDFSAFATKHPWLSSAASVPLSILSGYESADNAIKYLAEQAVTGDAKLNPSYTALASSSIRGSVSEKVDWEIGNWDAFDFLYNTAMSGADSLTSGLVFGNWGGAVLGLSAAAQGTNDALDRGMSDGQAFWNGLIAGTFEGLFESVSIGNLNKLKEVAPESVKDIIKNLGKSMLVNASEETLTELANITYDTLINGEFANYTWEELKNGAWKDALAQVVEAGASGALMGLGMGTTGNTIGYAKGSSEAQKTYGDYADALVGEALEIDPGNTFAQKMQGRLEGGKSLSGGQLNRLVQQNEKTMTAQDLQAIENATAQRLHDLGVTENVEAIAQALTKQAAGQELSWSEKRLAKQYDVVAQEMNPENIRDGKYTAAWAQKIGTNKINAQEYNRMLEADQTAQEAAENAPGQAIAQGQKEAQADQTEPKGATVREDRTVEAKQEDTPVATGEGSLQVAEESSETEEVRSVTLADASKKYGAQAQAMIHTYQEGQEVAKYDAAYRAVYDMGRSGVSISYAMKSPSAAYLTEAQRGLAYEAGEAAANTAAHGRAAEIREAANGKTGHRKGGLVRGEGVTMADLKQAVGDTRGTAYKTLSTIAKVTGIDIVLYKSSPDSSGAFREAQGKYRRSEPGTLYIDINAGLSGVNDVNDLAKYTILRTFGHEFTHFIENWNPIQYNEFRKVVFDTLTRQGEDVEFLIEQRQKAGIDYEAASREVVAEAMTDILPDATFVQTLADHHKTIFQKLLDKLKEFTEKIRDYFASLGSNRSREANALKVQVGDTVKYLDSIVKLFDSVAVEAVRNYQLTVAAEEVAVSEMESATAEAQAEDAVGDNDATTDDATISETETVDADNAEEDSDNTQEDSNNDAEGSDNVEDDPDNAVEAAATEAPADETEIPPKAETEEAKQELRKAVRMPIQGTNMEALLEGIKNKELSLESVTLSGSVEGFNAEQRHHLVEKLLEGVYTDSETIKIEVPYDGKFEIVNTPGNVAKVLDNLKVKARQEAIFDKKTISLLTSNGDVRIVDVDGQKYLSNSYVMLPATEAAVEYARTELNGKENQLHPEVAKAFEQANKPLVDAPTEAKLDKTTVLIFSVDGKKLFFDKRLFAPLDGGQLYYADIRGAGILKSVDSSGKVIGYLMGIRPSGKTQITGEKPSNLKSYQKKKLQEKPAEKAAPKREAKTEPKKKSAPAPRKTESKASKPATVESSVKLEDFGEKIGGARKDQWSKRGLLAEDLDEMNDREREKNVKKDNVWKRPDYRKLIEGGADRNILFVRNEIRKALNQNIAYPYRVSDERKQQIQEEFVATVRAVQAMAEKVTTKEALAAMGRPWLMEQGYRTDTSFTEKWRKNAALQGTNYVQTIEHLVRNWEQLGKLADKANFAVDAEKKIPNGFSIHEDDNTHTWFIARGNWVVRHSIPSYDEALNYLRNAASNTKKKTRFVPEQLQEVHRKGPDYRAGKDVKGQDYLDTFGFKGGEFGNWMTEKDRRVSMNYGFDALKDLADALVIADQDISLAGNLSIAFGARGQGLSGAAAHYEQERHVINLTKMNGAGSLAHEWFHALDDFLGGYGSKFATEYGSQLPETTKAAVRHLLTTMQYRDATQEETDMAATKTYEQARRSVTYQVANQFGWVRRIEEGKFDDSDARYYSRKPTEADVKKYHELLDNLLETGDMSALEELSALRKAVNGHVIPKEDRESIGFRLRSLRPDATKNVQKMRLRSDFYNNSRRFGELHHKDGDYWDSTIEMAARAFACYVADKTGKHNDYLSAHSDTAVTLDVDKDGNVNVVRAFPVGEERVQINAAFDQLIAALKADGFLHEQGETVKPEMIQYQSRSYLSEAAREFRDEIGNWDKRGRPDGETFILGSTGAVLQGLGAIENDVYMRGDKIKQILNDHPEMSLKEIKNIPEILENPVMIMSSRNVGRGKRANTRLTVYGMVRAQNKMPVLVAFDLHPAEGKLYLADMQKVVSAYTKDSSPTAAMNLMQNSEVLYADKEKTAALLRSVGFQMPIDLLRNGYIGSISYSGTEVNIQGVQFYDVVGKQDEQNQERTSALTDRDVLAMAAEDVSIEDLTDGEKDALRIFKERLGNLHDLQNQRQEQGRLYREQQFGTNVDREAAKQTLERMRILDGQIKTASDAVLDVEQKSVLRQVLQKARKVVEQQEREHGQEVLKRWRDRRNDAAAIKKYRERLTKDVNELTNWVLHPNNKDVVKHIPDVLKNSVISFLSSIDFTSKQQLRGGEATKADQEFMKRLRGLKAALKPNASTDGLYADYSDLPPNFMERLQDLIDGAQAIVEKHSGEFVVNQMTSQELRELSQVVRTLKQYIQNVNRFHANAMFQHVSQAGDNTIEELALMKNASEHTGTVSNFVLWQQMRPAYAFERFGEGGKAIYDGLRRGQAKLAFNTKTIQEFAEKAYTEAEVKAWEKEIKSIKLGGDIVKMPVSTIMSFYELTKRPQALGHILGQGIRVATYKANGKKISDAGHRVELGDVATIIGMLTDRQKEVADKLQKFMQEQGGKWGNYVSVKRFGEELFGEENYFPINSDGRHLAANADEHPSAASLYALLNMGFTKATTEGANNRLVLYSIFDVFANHMASMAQYNAFALPVVDAIKWFNYQQKSDPETDGHRFVVGSVRDQMDRVYGVPEETRPGSGRQGYAQTFVINILKAFNGTEAQGVPTDVTGMNALRRYNMAQVAFNFRVIVQQPLAITRAALLVDYTSILKGMRLRPAAIRKNIQEMQQHSGIAAWKGLGFYDVNISRGLTDIIKHNATALDKVNEVGMWGAEKADLMTWAGIWSACKEEVTAKQKLTPKSEGFFDAVTQLFEDVVYKTQVVDSVLTKNEFLRSKGFFARATGSFMSEPATTASMLIDAYDKFRSDMQRGMSRQQAWKKNSKVIVRTAYVYGVGAAILAAVQAVADAFRDDDDYQEWYEKWLEAFGGNLVDEVMPLNKLPILSDFYEVAKELLSVFGIDTYGNAPASVFMQWYDSLVKGVQIIHGKITGEEDRYTWYGGAYKLLQAASGITGLPMAAATREIVTAWNNTVGAMAPSLKVKTYDAGEKNEIKYAYQDGWLTYEEAMEQLLEQGLVDNEDEAYWTMQGWEAGAGYSRYDAIYDAVLNGGDIEAAMEELTSRGYKEDDVLSQVKSQIGKWYYDAKSEVRITKQQAIDMLTKYTKLSSEDITTTVNKWSSKVVTGIAYDDIDDEFMAGNITEARAKEMYVRYGGLTEEKAHEKVYALAFRKAHPACDGISYAAVAKYETCCEELGVEAETFYDVWKHKNADGVSKAEAMDYIHTLDLSKAQKNSLYYAMGWAKSELYKAPWN